MEQLAIKSLQTVYRGIYRYVIFSGNPTYMAIDTTDIEIPGAKKTPYVGYTQKKGGEGTSILVAGAVHRNRIIPVYFKLYSSKTIHEEAITYCSWTGDLRRRT